MMRLSQTEVAEKLKHSNTNLISRWERGVTLPSLENVLKLSVIYKTLVNELFYDYILEYQKELYPDERKSIDRKCNSP
jgi:transcriptional regulator with XRE-family HTH domain